MSCKPESDVDRLAKLVCRAARQAAVDGIDSALLLADERSVDAGDRMHMVANQILACAATMQSEIARFLTVARRRRS
jgi:hypothetical protein